MNSFQLTLIVKPPDELCAHRVDRLPIHPGKGRSQGTTMRNSDWPIPERLPVLILCAQISCLALARRLGSVGVRVGILDDNPYAPGWASRYCLHACVCDSPDEEEQLRQMEAMAALLGGRPALLATSDDYLLFISRHRDRLTSSFRLLLPSAQLLDDLLDKRRMTTLLSAHGIPVPAFRTIESKADLRLAAVELGFPCLLKSAYSKIQGDASAGKLPAASISELEAAYERVARFDHRVMVQEYIEGGCEQVALYNAYFNRDSQPVAVFTGRKLRQYPVQFGTACLSECGSNPEIAEPLTRFFQNVGYFGPVDVGMKWDRRTGVFKVLDINPRLGQNYRAFVAADGADLGWLAYCELSGQQLACRSALANPPRRRRWAIEDNDWRCARQLRHEGKLSLLRWFASLFRVHEFAYWDWKDPGPFVERITRRPTFLAPAAAVQPLPAPLAAAVKEQPLHVHTQARAND